MAGTSGEETFTREQIEGELKGIPPTGEEIEVTGVAIYRIEDGTIEKEWIIANFLRAFKQLGVVD